MQSVNLTNDIDDIRVSNDTHMGLYYFESGFSHILLAIDILFIPLIITPSSLVVSAVILVRKLHNPHNIILMAISVSNMVTALVVIPIRELLNIRVTREMIHSYKHLCLPLAMSTNAVELIDLCVLTLLGLDTFIQMKYPLKYKIITSIKKTIVSIVSIYLINAFIIIGLFPGLLILNHFDCRSQINVKENPNIKLYVFFLLTLTGLLLLLCIFFGVYVRYIRWKLGKPTRGKITTWLLMAFVIFYLPTIFVLIVDFNNRSWRHIARLIRHLAPVTNWIFIYLSRPHYKFAFRYFLRTNPTQWNTIESSYRRRRTVYALKHKNIPTRHLSNAESDNNFKPTQFHCASGKISSV